MATLIIVLITATILLSIRFFVESKINAERDQRERIAAIINAERAAAIAHYNASYQQLSGNNFYGSY